MPVLARNSVRFLGCLGALCMGALAAPARSADQSTAARLRLAEEDAQVTSTRMDRLQREYGQRRGLIGAEDALARYEEGVYAYLIGDYDRAALTFYTLVESESLTTEALAFDSEWYLSECVFELENWNTALESYARIMGKGSRHPFFADAVRRTLEVYGILRNNEKFYEVYRTWILSGKVPPTDAVRYTVAKSFYRQGELARAKAMFTELSPESSYYPRARYFLGTVLAREGQYPDALAEFERARAARPSAEVEELSNLAIGRVHYELGNYADAAAAYQRIPSTSGYFADQLYELVWTFIKQEAWSDALDSIEIFLVAFPDHEYSMTMRLYQGHLHRKAEQFERALTTYEGVVDTYQPIEKIIGGFSQSREQPAVFFDRMVQTDAIDKQDLPLPAYAVEMLRSNPLLDRAIGTARALDGQATDVEQSDAMAAEIRSVLQASTDAIGTFARGRQGLRRVHEDAVGLRLKLLDIELSQLESGADPSVRADVQAARDTLLRLTGDADAIQGADSARTERFQIHEDQVLAVQQVAFRLDLELADAAAELEAHKRALDAKRGQMAPEAVTAAESLINELNGGLSRQRQTGDRLRSDATRRTVMAALPRAVTADTDIGRAGLAAALDGLHRDLRGLRARVSAVDAPNTFARVDELWLRAADMDARADATLTALENAEKVEIKLLRAKLDEFSAKVGGLHGEVKGAQSRSDALAAIITQAGLTELERAFYNTVMEADMGIVDVYWLRRTGVEEERLRLKTERAERLDELEDRFNLIRDKLEE